MHLFAEKMYNIHNYAFLAEAVLDVLQGILLDIDTNARAIHANAFHETKLTFKKMRDNLQYVFGAIATLNKNMNAETRAGELDKVGLSDAINEYISCFSPRGDFSSEALETLLANTTKTFIAVKAFANDKEKRIEAFMRRLQDFE